MTNEIKLKTIYNGSRRALVTSKGVIDPGKSVTVPVAEADSLCVYRGVMDASKMANQGTLDSEIASLRSELAAAKKLIAELQGPAIKPAEEAAMEAAAPIIPKPKTDKSRKPKKD